MQDLADMEIRRFSHINSYQIACYLKDLCDARTGTNREVMTELALNFISAFQFVDSA